MPLERHSYLPIVTSLTLVQYVEHWLRDPVCLAQRGIQGKSEGGHSRIPQFDKPRDANNDDRIGYISLLTDVEKIVQSQHLNIFCISWDLQSYYL